MTLLDALLFTALTTLAFLLALSTMLGAYLLHRRIKERRYKPFKGQILEELIIKTNEKKIRLVK